MVGFVAFVGSIILLWFAVFFGWLFNLPVAPLLVIIATAAWAAWDSKKIELRSYKSSLAVDPVPLGIGVAALWPIGFPWYLAIRHRIKSGNLMRKDGTYKVPY
jgi:hypothetical protein